MAKQAKPALFPNFFLVCIGSQRPIGKYTKRTIAILPEMLVKSRGKRTQLPNSAPTDNITICLAHQQRIGDVLVLLQASGLESGSGTGMMWAMP